MFLIPNQEKIVKIDLILFLRECLMIKRILKII